MSEVGAKEKDKRDKDEQEGIEHIHIAVFFDGTSNNMVQQALFMDSFINTLKPSAPNANQNDSSEIRKLRKDINPFGLITETDTSKNILVNSLKNTPNLLNKPDTYGLMADSVPPLMNKVVSMVDATEELEKRNATINISAETLADLTKGEGRGYSNVAILYSLFEKEQDDSSLIYHIYIEGSGATHITDMLSKNINGLGFGLGLTGVTALVSKAIRRITNDVLSSRGIDNNTKFHFYVFGFSRGSTCARLFTHLITRDQNAKPLPREAEFGDFLHGNSFRNGRVQFLEDYKANTTVEFLGIYDTVASIGFLKQKDGWSDSMRAAYSWAENYKNNWHFMNVDDYGLYICQDKTKLKNVCHICALDEFRENFALTNIGSKVPSNSIEILIPGCHSDVGGGYGEGNSEQEIILHKQTTKNGKTVNTSISLLPSFQKPASALMYDPNHKPSNMSEAMGRQAMSIDALTKLGWIDPNWDKKNGRKQIDIQGTLKPCTITAVDNDGILLKYVKFKRNVKRGYSDIPLAMMRKCCVESCGNAIFKEIPNCYHFEKIPNAEDLISEGGKMMACVVAPAGQRIWHYPGESSVSEEYKNLRLKYIHFTSVGSLMHVNNPFRKGAKLIEKDAANFGNKPNFDLNGLLCRITYNGLRRDLKPSDYAIGVQYLYELPVKG